MLFITNRAPTGNVLVSEEGRAWDFDLDNNTAMHWLYFCERTAEKKYVEVTSKPFLQRIRDHGADEILVYIHGYSNLPEPHIFPRARALQALLDTHCTGTKFLVVPLIWPCDNDVTVVEDYWDDQKAADASGYAFARALAKLHAWQREGVKAGEECLKRINVLAHSMGNRVLRETLRVWSEELLRDSPPMIFRSIFMVAADLINETLERHQAGRYITMAARNVVVYFAADDLALRASKVVNLRGGTASRRLGHTGPEDLGQVPRNVYAVDCDRVNSRYDHPVGHTYFAFDENGQQGGQPGDVFRHICATLSDGRVPGATKPVGQLIAVPADGA